MTLRVEVQPDAASAARRAAEHVVAAARESVETRGDFSLALSKAPPDLLHALASDDLPWERATVYQVDERVAPSGHEDRNLTALLDALPPGARVRVRAMPVEEDDLERAAARYAEELPERLDLVHLGLGADGHTASLLPDDAVLDVSDRRVGVTGEYRGRRRMTLTYPALDAAREIVWLVTGSGKRDALRRLLERDPTIPAARVANPRQLVVADADAAGPQDDEA